MTLVRMTKKIDTFFADSKSLLHMSRFIWGGGGVFVFIFRNFKKKRGTKRENSYLNFAETNLDFSVKVGV